MENMNVHYIEAPYVKKSDSKFGSCTTRRIAQISSWILLIFYGFIFSWVLGNTLLTIISDNYGNSDNYIGAIWDVSTKQLKSNNGATLLFDYYGELLITNILLGVGLAFSILLVLGVHKRNTNMLLMWIIYFLAFCGVMILICYFEGEAYSSFKKILTIHLICLNFAIFLAISSYYKELREENCEVKNTRQIRVTIEADPLQPHLPPNFQNHLHWPVNQPYVQSISFPGEKN